jgi:hypothetical protein
MSAPATAAFDDNLSDISSASTRKELLTTLVNERTENERVTLELKEALAQAVARRKIIDVQLLRTMRAGSIDEVTHQGKFLTRKAKTVKQTLTIKFLRTQLTNWFVAQHIDDIDVDELLDAIAGQRKATVTECLVVKGI